MAGQDLEGRARLVAEGGGVRALHVEHAHQPVAVHEGDGQLGDHAGHDVQVARVARHVGDEDALAELGGRAHDAFSRADAQPPHLRAVVTLDEPGHERAVLLGQEDVEQPVVHDPPELPGDGGQELVGVEDGADLGHDGEQLGEELAGEGHTGPRVGGRQNAPS